MPSFPPISVYIINLDSRPDRWDKIRAQCLKCGINPIRISAVKASPGWHGCALSHQKIAKIAKEKNHEWYLVLEDDSEFSQNDWLRFTSLLPYLWEHKNDWDIFNGAFGQIFSFDLINKDPLIYNCNTTSSFFYFVNKSGIEKILEWTPNELPIDNYCGGKVKMIGTYPFIATQAISQSDLASHEPPDSARKYIEIGSQRVKELLDKALAKEAFRNHYKY